MLSRSKGAAGSRAPQPGRPPCACAPRASLMPPGSRQTGHVAHQTAGSAPVPEARWGTKSGGCGDAEAGGRQRASCQTPLSEPVLSIAAPASPKSTCCCQASSAHLAVHGQACSFHYQRCVRERLHVLLAIQKVEGLWLRRIKIFGAESHHGCAGRQVGGEEMLSAHTAAVALLPPPAPPPSATNLV